MPFEFWAIGNHYDHLTFFLNCFFIYTFIQGERHDTYHGLCLIIQNNPNLAITNFRYVAHALVSINKKQYLDDITNEIKQMFGQIVLGMKQSKGNDQAWEQFLKSCGIQGPLRDGLRQYYGV